jgi:hypothetical protein
MAQKAALPMTASSSIGSLRIERHASTRTRGE